MMKLGIQNPRKTGRKRTQLRINQLGQDSEDPAIPPVPSLSKERQGEEARRRSSNGSACPFARSQGNLENVVVPKYQFDATVTKNTHLQNYHIDDSCWWLSSV